MLKLKKTIYIILVGLIFFQPQKVLSDDDGFIISYVDRFPYHYREGETVKGLVADATDYAFKKSGLNYSWKEIPAIRMMVMLKENSGKIVMTGWFKNPEREKIGKFSVPVYRDKTFMIIAKKGNEKLNHIKTFKSLLADKSLTLLIKDGYSYGKVFDTMIVENHSTTYKVTVDMIKMVQMIYAGRGDYMFSNQEEGEFLIKSAGVPRDGIFFTSYPDSPKGENRHLMFSKKVSDDEIKIINRYILEYQKIHGK